MWGAWNEDSRSLRLAIVCTTVLVAFVLLGLWVRAGGVWDGDVTLAHWVQGWPETLDPLFRTLN